LSAKCANLASYPINFIKINFKHMNTNTSTPSRNFWLALAVQIILLASVPAQALYVLNSGTTVFLKTTPVDPVDLLRGYFQTLSYEISVLDTLAKLPGGEALNKLPNGQKIFVTLALPSNGRAAAQPIAVSLQPPTTLPPNTVILRGISNYSRVKYDLEQFYMPEQQQAKVNQDINHARQTQSLLIETKIGQDGQALPVAIWVGDKSYRF
jgi:uncharacterized membrane-anchored protein